jgi:hypothetical protein
VVVYRAERPVWEAARGQAGAAWLTPLRRGS